MKKYFQTVAIVFSIIAISLSTALGETSTVTNPTTASKSPETEVLPEVVVTATRTPKSINQTASSVSVISQEKIQSQQYRTITEALRSVPGLQIAQSGTPTQSTSFLIRGTESRHNRILIDGRPLPEGLGGSIVNDLSLDNVERIEVLRGPASSLYGGNAIGGVVNIITKKGQSLEKPETALTIEAGSFYNFREAARSRGAFGPFDYSVSASRQDADFQRDNNELRDTRWNGNFGYTLNPSLRFDLYSDYNLIDASSPGADPLSTFSKPGKYDNFLKEIWTISPGLTWQTTEIWTQRFSYQYQERRQHFYSPRVLFGSSTFANSSNRQQVDDHRIDYHSTVKVVENWQLTAGINVQNRKTTRTSDIANTTPQYFNYQTNTGFYLQSDWEILENWTFLTSGRIDHYSDFGNPMTFKVGSSYKIPVTETVIHANYGTAFSAPEEQNFISFGGSFVANPNIQPEDSRGYEVGITQPLLDKKIELRGVYFHNDIQGLVGTKTVSSSPFRYTVANLGDARTQGYELGLHAKPFSNVEVDTNYTYLDAVNKNSGAWLIRRPRHSVNSEIRYRPIESVRLGLEGSWVMNRIDNSPVTFNDFAMEDYFVMRFTADWSINSQWRIFGRIENLLNEQYSEVAGFEALDRGLYAGAEFKF